MLSPGKFYLDVPKGREDNLLWRQRLRQRWQANRRVRDGLKEACAHDILFYLNAFCFTYDPRTRLKSLPFITWPFQDVAFKTIIECIERGRDLVIEKSRDMGASWMSLTAMEWLWHFHPGHSFLMVSRKEDLVDSPGDPDSLFWKVDFIHRNQPEWLLPSFERRKLHFGNVANGSTIDGESTTAAAGVGGRRTAMFIDEFSRIEEGYQLLAGTADTTRCRIFNFTPYGTTSAAYKLARRTDVRKLRLHWSEHPQKRRGLYRYNDEKHQVEVMDKGFIHAPGYNFVLDGKLRSIWYDEEDRRRANPREMAMMVDIDYEGSAYQFFDKSLIWELQREYSREPYWEGALSYDADTGRPHELTAVSGGPLKLWLTLDLHGKPPVCPYTMGADLSTGTGATNSCLSIMDGRTGEKVGEYADPFISPEKCAALAVALCRLFKDKDGEGARFAWEMQGPGIVFGKRVRDLGYSNVYFRQVETKLNPKSDPDTAGWVPTPDNKRLLLSDYREALSMRQCVNRSKVALDECLQFIHGESGTIEFDDKETNFDPLTGKLDPSGARDNHGDRVIADALSWKMVKSLGLGTKKKQEEAEVKTLSLAWRRLYREQHRSEAW